MVPDEGAVHETFDVEPPYVPDAEALAHLAKYEDRFLDRELSWLRFNLRLLEMAEDDGLPLLERVRSMAFFASNLDEFFMVRVAGLKRRIAAGMAVRAASGMMPRDVLEAIWTRAAEQMQRHAELFRDEHRAGAVGQRGIDLVRWDDLDREEQKFSKRFFKDRVFPVLTPLAVDPAHPFPYISGLSLNMAVLVRNPKTGKEHFARVKVPPTFSRFVAAGNQRFVPLEDVIGEHLKRLFPGMEVLAVPHLPGHPQRGPRGRGGRRREPAAGAGEGAAAAPVRPAGAARGRGVDHPAGAGAAHLRARHLAAGGGPRRPARSTCAGCTTSPTCRARTSSTPPSCR